MLGRLVTYLACTKSQVCTEPHRRVAKILRSVWCIFGCVMQRLPCRSRYRRRISDPSTNRLCATCSGFFSGDTWMGLRKCAPFFPFLFFSVLFFSFFLPRCETGICTSSWIVLCNQMQRDHRATRKVSCVATRSRSGLNIPTIYRLHFKSSLLDSDLIFLGCHQRLPRPLEPYIIMGPWASVRSSV